MGSVLMPVLTPPLALPLMGVAIFMSPTVSTTRFVEAFLLFAWSTWRFGQQWALEIRR